VSRKQKPTLWQKHCSTCREWNRINEDGIMETIYADKDPNIPKPFAFNENTVYTLQLLKRGGWRVAGRGKPTLERLRKWKTIAENHNQAFRIGQRLSNGQYRYAFCGSDPFAWILAGIRYLDGVPETVKPKTLANLQKWLESYPHGGTVSLDGKTVDVGSSFNQKQWLKQGKEIVRGLVAEVSRKQKPCEFEGMKEYLGKFVCVGEETAKP